LQAYLACRNPYFFALRLRAPKPTSPNPKSAKETASATYLDSLG